VFSPTLGQLYPGERVPVPIVQEAGCASQPVWMCSENLRNPVVRTPDRPARSQLLHRSFFKLAQAYTHIYLFLPVGLTSVIAARREARQQTAFSLKLEISTEV
jgi:hypothetical protein